MTAPPSHQPSLAEPDLGQLSYARPDDPALKRWLMRTIERWSGSRLLLATYRNWRSEPTGENRSWARALQLFNIRLEVRAHGDRLQNVASDEPLVVIANHPFGLVDGLAILALAEQLGRPYRLLLNADIMHVPEIREVGLPLDFSGTREAFRTNLNTRAEVRKLLAAGVAIVIFPAGSVATADHPFGSAEDFPWKKFVARLVRQQRATVLPVFFEGQNSPLFHWVSRYSQAARLALLVRELRRRIGSVVQVTIGQPVAYEDIPAHARDVTLIDELYLLVHRLAPGAEGKSREELLPRPPEQRRQFPCEAPLTHAPRPTPADPSNPSGGAE